jgi:hypothetical protein
MSTIRSQTYKPWTQVREVKIAHRSIESVDTILSMAARRLEEFMDDLGVVDEGTVQLIVQLQNLRQEIH